VTASQPQANDLDRLASMATPSPSTALTKRSIDTALMPPPPAKRIKRPPKVLDEDDYTDALSKIIARDFFPGLHEVQYQQEYLNALESNDESWIAEAGQKLREVMTPLPSGRQRRSARNSRFSTPALTPVHTATATPVANKTPVGWSDDATPSGVTGSEYSTTSCTQKDEIDTSTLSLSAFQSKYTSEDNESFNALLDTQNATRRQKHAHLWTSDNRIPSARQVAYREREQRLLMQTAEAEAANSGKELVALVAGATDARPAKPDSWRRTKPDNAFMFHATSVDEDGIDTVAQIREASSKAGPKGVNYGNTRFTPQALNNESTDSFVPPSPSLNTSIIARRDAARDARSETEYSGGETPRVNGYAYVDEDEPENIPQEATAPEPSYRDLLAGQAGDGTPNPFKIREVRRREDLHHRMVERDAAKKRLKSAETVRTPIPDTPGGSRSGNLTPAARKLLDRVGRTPVGNHGAVRDGDTRAKHMWTPSSTPRRRAGVIDKK
jgi:protein DGCR14